MPTGTPLVTDDVDADGAAVAKARQIEPAAKPSLLERIVGFLKMTPDGALIMAPSTPMRLSETIRLAWDGEPFNLTLGDVALEFHQDRAITGRRP